MSDEPLHATLDGVLERLADLVADRVLERLNGAGDDREAPRARPDVEADRLLTAPEVAGRLACSMKLVYRSAARWPFTRRVGSRTLRFSAAGLERWLERRR